MQSSKEKQQYQSTSAQRQHVYSQEIFMTCSNGVVIEQQNLLREVNWVLKGQQNTQF